MTMLLVMGDDKTSRGCWRAISGTATPELCVDKSQGIARVLRLVARKALPLRVVARMALAEQLRRREPPLPARHVLKNNMDLQTVLRSKRFEAVVLFRAGLIIQAETLGLGSPIYNIHCASLPEFAGLGAIYRALRQGALRQFACLHKVTTKIDDASMIVAQKAYTLDPAASYGRNEDIAYAAGMEILGDLLARRITLPGA